MRKFFIISFITLALSAGAIGVVSVAHAQISGTASGSATAQTTATAQAAAPASSGNAIVPPATDISSSYNQVMIWIMSLFAWLVGVAAITLDNAVYYTVVTMGKYVSGLTAVGVTWRILRDIGNITLIFGFLAIGISMILNTERLGWGTKMLPMLLVAAVFLNFSLFISEAVIDSGNLFATAFYTQINGGQPAGTKDFDTGSIRVSNEGISNRIMQQVGLQTIYGQIVRDPNAQVLKGGNSWIVGFMSILLFLVTAFVLFSLAFILIARFVALIFLIIIAPIGFAGLAIPMLSGTAKKWWSQLFEQTVTAPVLLLMLYIALAVITDASFLTGFNNSTPDWTGYITGSSGGITGFGSMLLSFLVAMGLLMAVVIFAKKMGAAGAGIAMKAAGKLTFGTVSVAGRATLGGTGNLLTSKRMKSWGSKDNNSFVGKYLGGKYIARVGTFAGKGLQKPTYDIRNAPGVSAGLGALGINAGKGATFTAKQAQEAQYGVKPVKKWFEQSEAERAQARRERDIKKAPGVIEKAQADLKAGKITSDKYDEIVKPYLDILSKMPAKQLEELSGIKNGVDALVTNLSPQQFEALMKSDKLSDKEKGNITETRFRNLSTKIDAAIATGKPADIDEAQKELAKVNTKELPRLDRGHLLTKFVEENMSDDQYDVLNKEGVLNATEKATLDQRRKDRFIVTSSHLAPAVAANIKSLKWDNKKINALPADTLTNSAVLDELGSDALKLIDIARKGNLAPVDRQKLGKYLKDAADSGNTVAKAWLADTRVRSDLLIPNPPKTSDSFKDGAGI